MQTRRTAVGTVSAVLVAILLATGVPALGQTTYYVSDGTGSDGNSGANWGQAFKTVTHAVVVAVDGDTVLVTNGT